MARITVEDCQERVNNRFLLVQMAIKRVRQYAAGKVLPDDMSLYNPLPEGQEPAKNEG